MAREAQPVLRTARLTLVPLTDEHLDFEVELDADPEVMRFLGPARTPEQVRELHSRRVAAAVAAPGLGFWVGLHLGSPVGWWALERAEPGQDVPGGSAELGYRLLRRHWRQGFAVEGARELVRYGFAALGLGRIFGETMAVNTASRATLSAAGLTGVRTFFPSFADPLPGSEHGDVEYAIIRGHG